MGVIRKKEKKRASAAVAKDEAPKSVALARVEPETEVAVHFSPTLVRAAQRLDEKIVKSIDRLQRDIISLGEMFQEMQDKGYHRALGFKRFEQYLEARYPDQSKTQVNQAMRIVRVLTSGDSPAVSREDVREMPRDNAESLAKLKQQGHEITPQLIEDAKTMPIRRFQEEIVLPITEKSADTGTRERAQEPAAQPEVFVRRTFTLSGQVASRLAKAIEVAKWITAGSAPVESFDDRVIDCIVAEFLAATEADYNAVMESESAKGLHAARRAEDALGPEVPEDEADEYRIGEADGVAEVSEAAEDAEEIAKPKVVTCKGVKSDGTPCGSPAAKGIEYCHFHKGQAAAA